MRAVLVEEFGEPESLVVRDVDEPHVPPGHVLIDVTAAALNFPDVLLVAGTYQILPDLPFSPGKEVAGRVAGVGVGVEGFALGDRVAAQLEFGGYAQRVVVPAERVVRVPHAVPLDVAAATGLVYTTAYYALRRRGNLQQGETVLITGATGGVGTAAVQLAKAWGAAVIAVARPDRAELLQSIGADHVVAPNPSTLRDEVRELTAGRGVDVAVDAVGGELFAQVVRSMAWEGRLVVVGFAGGAVPSVKTGHLLVKNIGVQGLQVSDYRERDPDGYRAVITEILDMIAAGRIAVHIAQRIPLDQAGAALGALARRELSGRVILEP